MVGYHYDGNVILVQPFQSKHDTHRIKAYNTIMKRLTSSGLTVKTHILDNEASTEYRRTITDVWHCTYQLVPPDMHCRNCAKRAIQTFKAQFLAILAGVDPAFPASRWDLLLPHTELTLNLLWQSRLHPTKSAWEGLHGKLNFDATPLGPPGSRVIFHAKPGTRRSWDFRGKDGFYLEPALNHYHCYTVLTRDTQATCITDTLRFRHPTLALPTPTIEDRICHNLRALTDTIKTTPRADITAQLAAITAFRDIIHALPRTDKKDHNDATAAPPPRVATQPPRVPMARAAAAPMVTDNWTLVPTWRASGPTPMQPVAYRIRARTTNAFAALTEDTSDKNDDDYTDTALLAHSTPNLALPVLDHDTGETLEHCQLRRHPKYKQIWDASYADELGRLCQGIGMKPATHHITQTPAPPTKKRVDGTNTFRPIKYHDIPLERRRNVTYTHVVCEVRPQKAEPNRTCITIGGNRICYPGDCGTKTGSLELVKTTLNSVLSHRNAKFACFDISNFYLSTPLDRPEYIRIKLADIPQEFIDEYNLLDFVHDGWVSFEITKGVYGLKQAGKLANDLLTEWLAAHGYYQCATTPGLWRHKWRPIMFVLIMDDFSIEYCDRCHANHLLHALKETYKVTTDWTGSKFAGIDIKWDYTKRTCWITMDGYIAATLLKYGHQTPAKPQYSPHKHCEIVYGEKEQLSPDADTSPLLDATGVKRVQGVVGLLLYYARAVDNKLLVALSAIGMQQAKATTNTHRPQSTNCSTTSPHTTHLMAQHTAPAT